MRSTFFFLYLCGKSVNSSQNYDDQIQSGAGYHLTFLLGGGPYHRDNRCKLGRGSALWCLFFKYRDLNLIPRTYGGGGNPDIMACGCHSRVGERQTDLWSSLARYPSLLGNCCVQWETLSKKRKKEKEKRYDSWGIIHEVVLGPSSHRSAHI